MYSFEQPIRLYDDRHLMTPKIKQVKKTSHFSSPVFMFLLSSDCVLMLG